jgi:hypothetical protein
MAQFSRVPPDTDLPVTAVVRTGRALWLAERRQLVDD